jgi:hypothetical protein
MTDWVYGIRQRFSGLSQTRPPRWAILPGALICLALLGGGAWAGIALGGGSSTVTETFQVVRSGKVVTVHGVKKVVLPAKTITRKGKKVTLPASTQTLDRFSQLPPQTVVRSGRTVTVPASTITQTATITQTGPTQTVTTTSTVTETGPTVTVTITITT